MRDDTVRRLKVAAFVASGIVVAVVFGRLITPLVPLLSVAIPGLAPQTTQSAPDARAQRRRDRYHWYELTDAQDASLRAVLKNYRPGKQIDVMVGTPDALELAEDFDSAFRDANFDSGIYQAADMVDGLHTTDPRLANLITAATGIPVIVDSGPEEPTAYVALNFGRKRYTKK